MARVIYKPAGSNHYWRFRKRYAVCSDDLSSWSINTNRVTGEYRTKWFARVWARSMTKSSGEPWVVIDLWDGPAAPAEPTTRN